MFHQRSLLETQDEKTWKSYLQPFCTFVYSTLSVYHLPKLDASIEYNALEKSHDVGGLNKENVLAPCMNCFNHFRNHVLNQTHGMVSIRSAGQRYPILSLEEQRFSGAEFSQVSHHWHQKKFKLGLVKAATGLG